MKNKYLLILLLLEIFGIIYGCKASDNLDSVITVIITNTSKDIYDGDFITALASGTSKEIRFRIEPFVQGININYANGQIVTDESKTNGTSFTVFANAGGVDSEPVTFTVRLKTDAIVVTITNSSNKMLNGSMVTADSNGSGEITFRLKADVSGITLNSTTGVVTIDQNVVLGTKFVVIATCSGVDSAEFEFIVSEEILEITNEKSIIRSGTQITVTGTAQTIIFSLKVPVDGVSITPQGKLYYEYGKMFTYSGTSPAEGSRPQDGLRNTLTQGIGFTAKSFTVIASNANGSLTAEKEFTASREFYDDFREGINFDDWYISLKNWGGNTNGGGNRVSRLDHVQYSETDGLYLYAGGDYHETQARRRSGSAIATKHALGAGRYEVRMKVHPRMGVCSALWTFFYDDINGNESNIDNHEIDFELPGKVIAGGGVGSTIAPNSGTGYPSFESLLVTPWTRENVYSTTYHKTATPANDGDWHVYTYEWHTTMVDGKVKGQKVDFFVDGILLKSQTSAIPFISASYWIGSWFPASRSQYSDGGVTVYDSGWAGTPNFEMDVMMVDYFHYTPFDDEPWMRSTDAKYRSSMGNSSAVVTNSNQYPQSPITTANSLDWAVNVGNWASNPGFEYTTPIPPAIINSPTPAGVANAWGLTGSADIVSNNACSGIKAMSIPSGGSTYQIITGVYGGYMFDVSAYVKGAAAGASGTMRIEFLGFKDELIGTTVSPTNTIDTALSPATSYGQIKRTITVHADAKKMRVTFLSTTGLLYIDDVEIYLVK